MSLDDWEKKYWRRQWDWEYRMREDFALGRPLPPGDPLLKGYLDGREGNPRRMDIWHNSPEYRLGYDTGQRYRRESINHNHIFRRDNHPAYPIPTNQNRIYESEASYIGIGFTGRHDPLGELKAWAEAIVFGLVLVLLGIGLIIAIAYWPFAIATIGFLIAFFHNPIFELFGVISDKRNAIKGLIGIIVFITFSWYGLQYHAYSTLKILGVPIDNHILFWYTVALGIILIIETIYGLLR